MRLVARTPIRYGPKEAHSRSVGAKCPVCGVPFAVGDYTTLVSDSLTPGEYGDVREVHYACAIPKDN